MITAYSCKDCKHDKGKCIGVPRSGTHRYCFEQKEMTNADLIRAMTDDELNELFNEIYNAGVEDAVSYEWGHRTNSFEWTIEWLQQPVEGE